MSTEKQYWERVKEIDTAWDSMKKNNVYDWSYLTDVNVDMENCSHLEYNTEEFWNVMLSCLDTSVAQRLEDMGINWKSFPIKLNY